MADPAAAPIAHPVLQFARLIAAQAEPFRTDPPPGYQRGIDFYSAAAISKVIAAATTQFKKAHGRFPNLLEPVRFTDKIFWSKFFRLMKVPETGNKLLTARFIPAVVEDLIQCPPIVWHSTQPRIPRSDEIEPGTYFLKANFGSDRYRRVTYPMSEAEAEALDWEFEPHLRQDYNLWRGEWWYNVFQRELLLERAIGSAEQTTSWNFLVIAGEVMRVTVYQKVEPGRARKSYLSPEFQPLPIAEGSPAAVYVLPGAESRELMLAASRAIGAPLRFVRVDFLLDDEERPYLGEVTFAPGHGVVRLPSELDLRLGRLWDLRQESNIAN
jgi:hypothetical protein